MKVAVLKERRAGETRVAATPETVKKLIGMGCTLLMRHSRKQVPAWLLMPPGRWPGPISS